MSEIVACYRFVTDDLKSKNGETKWVVGEWQKQEGELRFCENGLHACLTPYDSLGNVYGSRWFRAEARGRILHGDDKFCASEMRLVSEIPSKVIHQWAVDCAYRVLHFYEEKCPDDRRPRLALEAAQAWINDPSEENLKKLDVAWAATRDAARDATRDATRDAAWDAARAATRDAAWDAAWAAAWDAAWAAAWAAAWDAAWAAAWAATRDAAWAATRDATRDAAWAATRDAARAAAWAATRDAAWAATRDAAWAATRDAARAATRDAAWDAAWDATRAAAWDAAWAAAWAAAWDAAWAAAWAATRAAEEKWQREHLNELIQAALGERKP